MKLPNSLNARTNERGDGARWIAAWLVAWVAFGFPGLALAGGGVLGENVVDGTATFDRNGGYTTITASDGAIIHYERFDIAERETVEFVQPGADAAVLNRVFGDASQIMGTLKANGRVYLLNASGIYFGGSAIVDVAGLYAVAGQMSNTDFLANIDRFTHLTGTVENWGEIRGEVVALIGRFVRNHGTIVGADGLVAMVAGEEVVIGHLGENIVVQVDPNAAAPPVDVPGVEQAGEIDAGEGRVILAAGDVYSLAVRHPGMTRGKTVRIEGGAGRVELSGGIDATGSGAGETGGSVHVLGDEVLVTGGEIDASGEAGGGEILVGGDYLGGGGIQTSSRTLVDEEARLIANASDVGNGGRVIVWSDVHTKVLGTIEARGGANGGNGGFIETSSKNLLEVASVASVDASAPFGNPGLWLLDPRTVTIADGADVDGSFDAGDPNIYTPDTVGAGTDSTADRNTIQTSLNGGTDVVITTTSGDAGDGDIIVADSITKSAGTEATLTLTADRDIVVNDTISSTSDELNIDFNATRDVDVNANIDTNGGDFASSGADFDSTGAEITTAGGNVDLDHDNATFIGADAVNLDGTTIATNLTVTANTGNITDSGTNSVGGDATFTTVTADADITIDATAVTGSSAFNTSGADGDVIHTNATAVDLAASSVGGDLTVTATTGNITDSGTVTVGGNIDLTTSADDATITTNQLAVAGAIALTTNGTTGNATIVNATAVDLAASTVDGNLDVTATTGNLTDSGQVDVTGNATLTTSEADADIDVTQVFPDGTVAFNTTGSGGNADYQRGALIDIAASNVGGNLTVTSLNNSIQDSGTVTVGGNADFTTDTANQDITVDQLSVTGTVAVDTNGANGDATITNAIGTDLAASSVGGDLTVTATTGNITDSGTVTVGSDLDVTTSEAGADIDLGTLAVGGQILASTNGAGANAVFENATNIDFAATSIGGNLDATAITGDISDDATVTVGGDATFTTSVADADISLDTLAVTGSISANTNGTGGNATVTNATGVDIGTSAVGGNLDVTATTGDITDSGTATVGGDLVLVTSADDADITANQLAVTGLIDLETNGTSGNATIVNATAVDLAASTVDGDLDVTAITGNIVDSGQVDVTGNATFTTTAADADIDLGTSFPGGTVAFNTTGSDGNVSYSRGAQVDLAASNVGGNLSVTSNNNSIVDSGTVTVGGNADFTSNDDGSDITLDTLAVTGSIALSTDGSGGDATITNAVATDLAASDVGGDLTVTATTGNLTDSGTIDVGGDLSLTTSGSDATITADQLDVSGTIALATNGTGAGNATITNAQEIDFITSSVDGNLAATTSSGDIIDSGTVTVGGDATFTTTIANDDVSLGSLAVTGSIAANTSGATGNVTLVNTTAVDLGASSVGGTLNATATTGNLTDSGTVTVGGDASLETSEANADIVANQLAVTGDIDLTTSGAGGDATIVNATTVDFDTTSIGGDLTATATTGNVTDDNAVTVGGDASFTASAVDADIALNQIDVTGSIAVATNGPDANVTLVNGSGIDFVASSVGNDVTATATTGNISDSGALVAGGDVDLTTSASGATITLDQTNVTGAFTFATSGAAGDVSVSEAGGLTVGASSIGGDFSGTATTGDIAVTGQIETGGTGGIDLTAAGGNVALSNVDSILRANGAGGVAITTNAVTVADATAAAEIRTDNGVTLTVDAAGATNSLDIRNATALTINDTGVGTINVREVDSGGTATTIANTSLTSNAANTGAITVEYFNDSATVDSFTATVGAATQLSSLNGGAASDLDIDVTAGSITGAGTVTVDGDLTLNTQEVGADVTLASLDVSGTVDVTTTGAGTDVTLGAPNDLTIVDIVATGDVALSSVAGDIDIQSALGDGTALTTLTVTAGGVGNEISMRDVTSTGAQRYDGDVVLTGDATLTQNGAIAGDAIVFTGTIDGTTAGTESLTIDADGAVEFADDVGATTALDAFSVQVDETTGALVRFAKAAGEQIVRTVNDILLNPNGRTTAQANSRATIVRNQVGDLRLESTNGDVTMGRGERLSVPGDLTIVADNGRVSVGDLTAREIDIDADSVTLLLRDAGTTEVTIGNFVDDGGVDIIANEIDIDVSGAANVIDLDGNGIATFGVQRAPGSTADNDLRLNGADIQSGGGGAVVQFSANRSDSSELDASDILPVANVVLDGIALGASQQVLFVSGLIPQLPEPPDPPEVGPAPPKKEEVMAWMQCAQIEEGDEVPAACLEAGVGDFSQDAFQDSSALGVLQLYRALVRSNVTIDRIGPAFQSAIADFQQQAENDQELGIVFRKYLKEQEAHREAADYLEQFEFLFAQLKKIKMLPNDYKATRDELLLEILKELKLQGVASLDGLTETFIPGETDEPAGTGQAI